MKQLAVVVAVAIGACGLAGAQGQTWPDAVGNGTFTFQGCYNGPSFVRCDLTYVLTRQDTAFFAPFSASNIRAVNANGASADARGVSVAGGAFSPSPGSPSANVVKGIPVKVSVELPLPKGTRSIRALIFRDKRFENVPVSSGNSPAPSAGSSAAPAPVVTSGGYSIQLSGCMPSGNGAYTCTGAVVTPKR